MPATSKRMCSLLSLILRPPLENWYSGYSQLITSEVIGISKEIVYLIFLISRREVCFFTTV